MLRRFRSFRPALEPLEPIVVLSTTVTALASQIQAAFPVIDIATAATATGQGAKARNLILVEEHVFFGAQTQTVLVGAALTSPGATSTVDATANQVELAAPIVDVVANASASGKHALAINVIVIDINIVFGSQSQTVVLGSGGTGTMSTVTVSATADQALVADPEVDLIENALASGNRAVAINRITITETVYLGDQTATTTVGGLGVNLAGLVNVTSTATQSTINDPTTNVSESSLATGPGALAQNKVKVTEQVQFGLQQQLVQVGLPQVTRRDSNPRSPDPHSGVLAAKLRVTS